MADSPQIDYAVVLADLKDKRERLDAAIAGIEAMLGLQAAGVAASSGAGNGTTGAELGPGAFLGMTIVDAVVKLLAARRKALRTEEIVSEIKRGGIAFSTETPVNTVGSILNRDFKNGGEIVSVGRGQWGLAEWHPRLRKKRPEDKTLRETITDAVDDSAAQAADTAVIVNLVDDLMGKGTKTEPEPNPPEPDKPPIKSIQTTSKKPIDDFDDDIPF